MARNMMLELRQLHIKLLMWDKCPTLPIVKKGYDSYKWLIKNHPYLDWMKEYAAEMED